MVREHNEDNAYCDPEGMFFVVADGMGGHAAGEVASAMAVEEVSRSLGLARDQVKSFAAQPTEEGRSALVTLLEDSVRKAHQAVFERGGRESDKKGMGTTLDVLLLAGGEAFVAHVGDSRTYLLRGGAAAQVTTDHTVAEVLVIEGKLSPEEARLSPLRTILVNAIGVSPDVGVELAHLKLRRGDLLLLCSDGMHDYYPAESEIAEMLTEERGEKGLARLVELAKDRGGHDNITGVLVEVVEGNPTVEEEEADMKKAGEELLASQSSDDLAAVPVRALGAEATMPHDDERPTEPPRMRGAFDPEGTMPGPVPPPKKPEPKAETSPAEAKPEAPDGKDAKATKAEAKAAKAEARAEKKAAQDAKAAAGDKVAGELATSRTEEMPVVVVPASSDAPKR
jgi:serine/threonine protein phosphatase PrpC